MQTLTRKAAVVTVHATVKSLVVRFSTHKVSQGVPRITGCFKTTEWFIKGTVFTDIACTWPVECGTIYRGTVVISEYWVTL